MLRAYISKQLQRIAIISLVKQITPLTTKWSNTNILTQKLPHKFVTYLPLRRIYVSAPLEKYSRKSGSQDVDSDSEDEEEPEFKDEKDSKVVKTKVNSLRADLLLKAGLGIARNKIENIFYESRIRLNNKKLAKKSVQLNVGDEIDVIRGFSQQNPSYIVVSRVVLLSASENEENFSVNLRRYKNLLIENYSGTDAFK